MCNCCCNNNIVKEPICFTVGDLNAPSNGSTQYINPDIKYLKYIVSKNGFGTCIENSFYERLPNGGFKLLNSSTFDTGEIYTLNFYN